MSRFQINDYDFNYDRHGAWVRFVYKGDPYLFEHTIEQAKERGILLQYGSDAFAQLVLALEDLARMIERGIYDLSQWIVGMRYLPPASSIPVCFQILHFDQIPASAEEVAQRYRQLAKTLHPDAANGNTEQFVQLRQAYEECLVHYNQ